MNRKFKDQNGSTIVEFVLVALPFFLVIFGSIEISLLLFNQQVITNCAREGARYGIVARPSGPSYKVNKAEIVAESKKYAEDHVVSFKDKDFSVSANFQSNMDYCKEFQDVLTVEVSYEYGFLFLPIASKKMGARAIMVCE